MYEIENNEKLLIAGARCNSVACKCTLHIHISLSTLCVHDVSACKTNQKICHKPANDKVNKLNWIKSERNRGKKAGEKEISPSGYKFEVEHLVVGKFFGWKLNKVQIMKRFWFNLRAGMAICLMQSRVPAASHTWAQLTAHCFRCKSFLLPFFVLFDLSIFSASHLLSVWISAIKTEKWASVLYSMNDDTFQLLRLSFPFLLLPFWDSKIIHWNWRKALAHKFRNFCGEDSQLISILHSARKWNC